MIEKEKHPKMLGFITESEKLGFVEISHAYQAREMAAKKIKSPKLKRVEEAKYQLSYMRLFDGGYAIKAHTSYDYSKKDFSETGRFWIVITAPGREGTEKGKDTPVLTSFFYRTGNFLVNAINEMRVLSFILENRPVDSKDEWMDLVEDSKNPRNIFFQSRTDSEEKISIWDLVEKIKDPALKRYALQRKRIKDYYEYNVRTEKTARARNLRIPYTQEGLPSSAVPVL